MIAHEQGRDLGDQQLHINHLECCKTDRNNQNRSHDPMEPNSSSKDRDKLAIACHLRKGESHRPNEDHPDQEVVQLKELRPPKIEDQKRGDRPSSDQSGRVPAVLHGEFVGQSKETIHIERDIDHDNKAEQNHEQREDIQEILARDVSIEGTHTTQ